MTEEQWLNTTTAPYLIKYLARRASQRKLRLFACAACRRILHMMQFEASRKAVQVSERFADGQADGDELRLARSEAAELADTAERLQTVGWNAARTAAQSAAAEALAAAERAALAAADGDLVREHFGNPFRPRTITDHVLSWEEETVTRLALAAYDERILRTGRLDNARLAVLADALEEAGCTDEIILTHLRGGDRHYRGCWVVDLILGKS
jgi:hypothetical protein